MCSLIIAHCRCVSAGGYTALQKLPNNLWQRSLNSLNFRHNLIMFGFSFLWLRLSFLLLLFFSFFLCLLPRAKIWPVVSIALLLLLHTATTGKIRRRRTFFLNRGRRKELVHLTVSWPKHQRFCRLQVTDNHGARMLTDRVSLVKIESTSYQRLDDREVPGGERRGGSWTNALIGRHVTIETSDPLIVSCTCRPHVCSETIQCQTLFP